MEDHVPSSAVLCTGEPNRSAAGKERTAYITSTPCKVRLRHDIEPDSPVPDLLTFQTSRAHDKKSTSKLDRMQHHLQISEKDVLSCQSQSSLTNIHSLHLPIPF